MWFWTERDLTTDDRKAIGHFFKEQCRPVLFGLARGCQAGPGR